MSVFQRYSKNPGVTSNGYKNTGLRIDVLLLMSWARQNPTHPLRGTLWAKDKPQ